jgi:MFS family permease
VSQLLAQTPVGDLIDKVAYKREILVFASVLVAATSISIPLYHSFGFVAVTRAFQGIGCAIIPPGVAAITLGVVGPQRMPEQLSKNEMFNNSGYAFFALVGGLVAYFWEPAAVFFLVGVSAVLAVIACYSIPASAINDDMSRGLGGESEDSSRSKTLLAEEGGPAAGLSSADGTDTEAAIGYMDILKDSRFLIFSVSVGFFHFGNAVVLPLLGQV